MRTCSKVFSSCFTPQIFFDSLSRAQIQFPAERQASPTGPGLQALYFTLFPPHSPRLLFLMSTRPSCPWAKYLKCYMTGWRWLFWVVTIGRFSQRGRFHVRLEKRIIFVAWRKLLRCYLVSKILAANLDPRVKGLTLPTNIRWDQG